MADRMAQIAQRQPLLDPIENSTDSGGQGAESRMTAEDQADGRGRARDSLVSSHGETVGDSRPHNGTGGKADGQSGSSTGGKHSWKLKYQDFIPSTMTGAWDKAEPFQKLTDRANDWLQSNPDVHVRTCESVTWMSHDRNALNDPDQMTLSKSIVECSHTYYQRGLRMKRTFNLFNNPNNVRDSDNQDLAPIVLGCQVLWLVPHIGPHRTSQVLSHTDVVPQDKDTVPDLLQRLNRKLHHKHIKGRVLSVETVGVPVVKGRAPSGSTRWSEEVDKDTPCAFFLRVHTEKDETGRGYGPDKALIGIKDIVPLPMSEGGYEGFEVLLDRAKAWVRDQGDISILNMQSVLVQKDSGPHLEIGNSCFYTMPGITKSEPVEFFRILRIVYVKHIADWSVIEANVTSIFPFTYETFTPEVVRQRDSTGSGQKERLEKMKETFSKVIAFLRNTGTEVICSETVMNPLALYIDESEVSSLHEDEMRFLFTIRLYLCSQAGSRSLDSGGTGAGGATTGSSSGRIIKRGSLNQVDTEMDLLQGGGEDPGGRGARSKPLFLRHVVGRQFKYRWLVLALSVSTCMAIIVVVSVVYSNQ